MRDEKRRQEWLPLANSAAFDVLPQPAADDAWESWSELVGISSTLAGLVQTAADYGVVTSRDFADALAALDELSPPTSALVAWKQDLQGLARQARELAAGRHADVHDRD